MPTKDTSTAGHTPGSRSSSAPSRADAAPFDPRNLEQALRRQTSYLRDLIDSSLDMIISVDHDRKIVEFNPAAEKAFGYTREEVIGKGVEALYADRETSATVNAQLQEGGQFVGEITNRCKDGSSFPAFLSASALREAEDGAITGIMGISRDITEPKRTAEALLRSREYLKNLVESSLDMIIAADVERRIVEFNRAAERTFGYARDELLGRHVDILYADPEESREVHRVIADGGQFKGEIANRRKNGQVFPALLSAALLRDAEGRMSGVMGISRDITREKQAEQELTNHRERLELAVAERTAELVEVNEQLRQEIAERKQAEDARRAAELELEQQRVLSMRTDRLRSLGEMAAGIAHELNQPLSGVRGLAEHLLVGLERGWDAPQDRLAEKLQLIVDQADRMTHIIEHVRMFAREAGKPEVQPINVSSVAESCIDMLDQQFRDHGVTLEHDLASALPTVLTNPFSLEEVILNLLANACDALEDSHQTLSPGPRVLLRTRADDSDAERPVKIEVIDNGNGIRADVLPRIFDPFFTTKEPDKGTGLGLAISRTIVEDFSGTIEIESEPAKGTRVVVSLPTAKIEHVDDGQ